MAIDIRILSLFAICSFSLLAGEKISCAAGQEVVREDLRLAVEGRAAHGSRPDLGVDANLEMGRLLGRLAALEEEVAAMSRQTECQLVGTLVQALPSLHGLPLSVLVQPLAGAQASSVHGLPSLQALMPAAPHWPRSPPRLLARNKLSLSLWYGHFKGAP